MTHHSNKYKFQKNIHLKILFLRLTINPLIQIII